MLCILCWCRLLSSAVRSRGLCILCAAHCKGSSRYRCTWCCTASHLCHEVPLQCAPHKTQSTWLLTAAITDVLNSLKANQTAHRNWILCRCHMLCMLCCLICHGCMSVGDVSVALQANHSQGATRESPHTIPNTGHFIPSCTCIPIWLFYTRAIPDSFFFFFVLFFFSSHPPDSPAAGAAETASSAGVSFSARP